MPDIFSSSEEFQAWFDSWSSPESAGNGGTDAARAAQREEQVCWLIVMKALFWTLANPSRTWALGHGAVPLTRMQMYARPLMIMRA